MFFPDSGNRRGSHQKIAFGNTRLFQTGHRGPIPAQNHNIQRSGEFLGFSRVLFDDDHIVTLPGGFLSDGPADLSAAGNNDSHIQPPEWTVSEMDFYYYTGFFIFCKLILPLLP